MLTKSKYPATQEVLNLLVENGFKHEKELLWGKDSLRVWTQRDNYIIQDTVKEESYQYKKNFSLFKADLRYMLGLPGEWDKSIWDAYGKYIDFDTSDYGVECVKAFYDALMWAGSLNVSPELPSTVSAYLEFESFGYVGEYVPLTNVTGYTIYRWTRGVSPVTIRYDQRWLYVKPMPKTASDRAPAYYSLQSAIGFIPGLRAAIAIEDMRRAIKQGYFTVKPEIRGLFDLLPTVTGYNESDAYNALAFVDARKNFGIEIDLNKKLDQQNAEKERKAMKADASARIKSDRLLINNSVQSQLTAILNNKQAILRDLQLLAVSAQGAMRGR